MSVYGEIKDFALCMKKRRLKVHNWNEAELECEELFPAVRGLMEWYVSKFRMHGPHMNLTKELQTKQMCNAYETIKKGIIWDSKITAPAVFVLKLKQNAAALDFRAQIAAILSLWNTAVTKW